MLKIVFYIIASIMIFGPLFLLYIGFYLLDRFLTEKEEKVRRDKLNYKIESFKKFLTTDILKITKELSTISYSRQLNYSTDDYTRKNSKI